MQSVGVGERHSVPLHRINGQGQGEDRRSWLRQTLADVTRPWMELIGECRDTLDTMTNILIVAVLHLQTGHPFDIEHRGNKRKSGSECFCMLYTNVSCACVCVCVGGGGEAEIATAGTPMTHS